MIITSAKISSTSELIDELKSRGYRVIKKEKLISLSVYDRAPKLSIETGQVMKLLAQRLGQKALAAGVLPHTNQRGVDGPEIHLFATFIPVKPDFNWEAVQESDR